MLKLTILLVVAYMTPAFALDRLAVTRSLENIYRHAQELIRIENHSVLRTLYEFSAPSAHTLSNFLSATKFTWLARNLESIAYSVSLGHWQYREDHHPGVRLTLSTVEQDLRQFYSALTEPDNPADEWQCLLAFYAACALGDVSLARRFEPNRDDVLSWFGSDSPTMNLVSIVVVMAPNNPDDWSYVRMFEYLLDSDLVSREELEDEYNDNIITWTRNKPLAHAMKDFWHLDSNILFSYAYFFRNSMVLHMAMDDPWFEFGPDETISDMIFTSFLIGDDYFFAEVMAHPKVGALKVVDCLNANFRTIHLETVNGLDLLRSQLAVSFGCERKGLDRKTAQGFALYLRYLNDAALLELIIQGSTQAEAIEERMETMYHLWVSKFDKVKLRFKARYYSPGGRGMSAALDRLRAEQDKKKYMKSI